MSRELRVESRELEISRNAGGGAFRSRLSTLGYRLAVALFATAWLASCGFHLRGQLALPFSTVHVPGASALAQELKRSIAAGTQAQVVDDPKAAQAVLHILSEIREKQILSVNAAGRVREFQLRYRVSVRLVDAASKELMPASEIVLKRDFTFNDTQVLAKESEEALLYKDMQSDAVQQVMRRLAAARI
ncbi:MAG: hypothetical protein HYU77_03325 [Betaproteobacteria bacterium]|nr:hypothetical protein [Betaproteobacteria bacterium]